jgi:hypothetical protein
MLQIDELVKNVNVDGLEFQINLMDPLDALALDKKVVGLLLPMAGEIQNLNSEINIGSILNGLSDSFMKMPKEDFKEFIVDMFSCVICNGSPPLQLTRDQINKTFKGKLFSIYKLIWEVMKFNKFSPFELLGAGGVTMETLISNMGINSGDKPGPELEKSEN